MRSWSDDDYKSLREALLSQLSWREPAETVFCRVGGWNIDKTPDDVVENGAAWMWKKSRFFSNARHIGLWVDRQSVSENKAIVYVWSGSRWQFEAQVSAPEAVALLGSDVCELVGQYPNEMKELLT